MSNHAFINLFYHLVWSTKDRDLSIKKEFQKKLYNYIHGITIKKNWHLVEIGGTQDHIHILLQVINFKDSVPDIIRCIKSNSCKLVRDCFDKDFAWQSSYSAHSVGRREVEDIKHYIQNQEEHHKFKSCEEEQVMMLKRNKIKYGYRPFHTEEENDIN